MVGWIGTINPVPIKAIAMKIYTKKGDKGMTTLYDGTKVSKSEINLRIIGEVDELSSRIGMLCVFIKMENGM